jgi:hypothetical protein
MKKPVANHLGPESCVASRKAGREALTGIQAGSRRCQAKREATGLESPSRDDHRPARSKTPDKPGNSMRENRETQGVPDSGPEGERDER